MKPGKFARMCVWDVEDRYDELREGYKIIRGSSRVQAVAAALCTG